MLCFLQCRAVWGGKICTAVQWLGNFSCAVSVPWKVCQEKMQRRAGKDLTLLALSAVFGRTSKPYRVLGDEKSCSRASYATPVFVQWITGEKQRERRLFLAVFGLNFVSCSEFCFRPGQLLHPRHFVKDGLCQLMLGIHWARFVYLDQHRRRRFIVQRTSFNVPYRKRFTYQNFLLPVEHACMAAKSGQWSSSFIVTLVQVGCARW